MSTGLIEIMKRASMEAVANAQMCDLRFGEVVSTTPLKVKVTNLFTIPESMLIVPEHLTDHEIKVTVTSAHDWETKFATCDTSHKHDITLTERKMKVHGALKTGDKVALLRKQGGQSFFILDRI